MHAPRLLVRRTTPLSVCLSCRRSLAAARRQFSSTPPPFASSATFQSYTLPTQPPSPPPNASVPDTSITRPIQSPPMPPPPTLPRVHETRPPRNLDNTGSAPVVSVPEQEAQQSKPRFANTTPENTSQPTATPKPRPSKLRAPRKAAMKLTPAAVEHLRAMLDQPDPKLIKVGVRNRGCSGLAYHLEYVDKAGAFDESVEQDGVKVLIDSKALFSIIGSEMDWVEDKLSQRFVFRNPNIKEQCGCGESFMV
ncbi:hypothetical protein B0H66DRAFT_100606 [Apodospora peruviana]|uniref:Iron-sulfur assembly protein 1 n=1 Tax=Apodospora peruviana TaxID=516989 RepID=A0AAE0HSW3_9PEZI|nr:hypothetical protein B0H66DRAFT_100606 [Apodospora peruviana]